MKILQQLIKQFMPFAQERFGFDDPPELFFKNDEQNASDPLGKTAFYDPQAKSVTLFVSGRHPKDILRSLAHELVHHTQNGRGDFDGVTDMPAGYAQSDPHLRNMEIEANRDGSMCLRDFEDDLKKQGTIYYEHLQKGDKSNMSIKDWKNKEIKGLMTEKWGFTCDLDMLTERRDRHGAEDRLVGHGESQDDRVHEDSDQSDEDAKAEIDTGKTKGDKFENEGLPEGQGYDDKEDESLGMRTGKESEKKQSEKDRRDDSYGKWGKRGNVNEDSGEDEAWHEWKNEHADDDHIKEIERHLRALKGDRDYEEDRSEDDHDHYEDEGHRDDQLKEAKIRRMVRNAIQETLKNRKATTKTRRTRKTKR